MTQAFNLSQLANNLNSTGQLDATDGLVNAVPVGNGGTGVSSLSGVAFGNGTSAFSAATSAQIKSAIGTLTVGDGGTGATSLSGLLFGNGATAFTVATANQIVGAIGTTAVTNATNAGTCSGNSNTVTNGVYTTNFTGTNQSKSSSGFQKFPGGLIIQWGQYNAATGTQSVTLPTAFPNACTSAICTLASQVNGFQTVTLTKGTSVIDFFTYGTGTYDFNYIAIGY